MCGIAGIFAHADLSPDEAKQALSRMRDAQHHRGPDDTGIFWDDRTQTGLSACRLAIRDVTPAGHMPMCIDGVCITYNGEIYNADVLRAQLQQAGEAFESHSDTEVILRGYKIWGEGVVDRLRGMFAFGILDTHNARLFLARDPLGIKPLYYTRAAPFCFGSELAALVATRHISMRIDETALSAYLQIGSIPAPLTIYQHVAALQPGHVARVPLGNPANISLHKYWSAPESLAAVTTLDDVKVALEDAVASHLVSDVPVGAFLSGGLDSSSIVAIAAPMVDAPLQTCSIAFESARHNESAYARAVANAFGTNHYERTITRADFVSALPRFFERIDQPTIDGFNTWFVAETASQAGLKVALSGLGGDELFGGYPTFDGVPRLLRVLKVARAGGRAAGQAIRLFTRSDRWRKVAAATDRPANAASALLIYRGLFTRHETEQLLPGVRHFDAERYIAERAGHMTGSLREWVGRAELSTYTSSQLLRDSDVMSMAHSLELRVPLLDRHLIDAVSALPPQQRFRRGRNKHLLRSIMADRLPALVMERRDRQGFAFPMEEWLQNDREPTWDSSVMRRFDVTAVDDVYRRFRKGASHWSRLWSLIALNEWSRRAAHA